MLWAGSRTAGCSGIGPTANRSFAGAVSPSCPRSASRTFPSRSDSSCAHVADSTATWSVPSRLILSGQACLATASPTAAGQALVTAASGTASRLPLRDSSFWISSPMRSISERPPVSPRAIARAHPGARRLPSPSPRSAHPARSSSASAARRSPSSSESTSSRSTSGDVPRRSRKRRSLGHHEREHGDALLTLRAEHAEVPPARLDPQVVQVRARASHAAVEVGVEAAVEVGYGRRLALVRKGRRLEAKPARGLGERLLEKGDGVGAKRPRARRRGSPCVRSTERALPVSTGPCEAGGEPRCAARRRSSTRPGGAPAPGTGGRRPGRGRHGVSRELPSRRRAGPA